MPPKTIPDKLPGVVCAQYIRCGKPNCRCARGELHGPFYYRLGRDHSGRQHKEYVRKANLEAVRNACEGRREDLKKIRGALARSEQRASRDPAHDGLTADAGEAGQEPAFRPLP